jgi:hypothetical protein
MKTAQAIFGALAAAVGLAAVVTFYDEFMPGTQMPPHPNEAAEKGDLLTPALRSRTTLPRCRSPFIPRRRIQSRKTLPPHQQSTATESEPRPATPRSSLRALPQLCPRVLSPSTFAPNMAAIASISCADIMQCGNASIEKGGNDRRP